MLTDLLDRALADFESVLKRDPGNIDALYGQGSVCERQGRFDQAIDAFTRVGCGSAPHACVGGGQTAVLNLPAIPSHASSS